MNASQPAPVLDRRRARALARRLVEWYEANARDLPWRRRRDAYGIWVSEIMLQQTRVEAVIPRYLSFLRRFPDLSALATADESEVLAEWAGLGYYRRARQLHAAARQLAEAGGEFPRTAAALRLLPGFGSYTAGAVASIAFDEPTPAVDGNVERVVARLLALPDDPSKGPTARTVRSVAEQLVESEAPRYLNQALMELGATVCAPRSPRCADCPWHRYCAGRATGTPEVFPRRPPRREPEVVAAYTAVHRDGDRLLWRQRPKGGHNAGLWELPTTEWHGGEVDPDRGVQLLGELGEVVGAIWRVREPIATIKHGITHHKVTFRAVRVEGTAEESATVAWLTESQARQRGLTAASNKVLRKLPPLL